MPGKPDVPVADDLTDADNERLDQFAWQFENAWEGSSQTAGRRPDLVAFLPPEDQGPLRHATIVELSLIDLEHRLKSGEAACVNDYLERFPDLLADRPAVQELIKAEYRCTLFQGYDWPPDDYAVRFPEMCDASLLDLLWALRRDPANDPNDPRFPKIRFHRRGGLGEVFEAWDRELKRRVALKKIRGDRANQRESQSKFIREAEITGQLEHPGIVSVYSLGRHADGEPFYAMRFVEGDNKLHDAIDRFHTRAGAGRDPGAHSMALRQLLRRLLDVCNAVAYAHSQGVIHCDLKPNNILLGPFGETVVVDWGLSKRFRGQVRDTIPGVREEGLRPLHSRGRSEVLPGSEISGAPAYMSPEQAEGRSSELCPASDVYSLGAMLYHVLTGRAPFPNPGTEAELVEVLSRVREGKFQAPREANPVVPRALEAICLKAMARKPEARYSTPRELGDDIEHWLADEAVTEYPDSRFQRLARWARHHRTWAQAGAGSMLLVTLISTASALVVIQALHQAQQRSADLAWAQGVVLCEQGESSRGLLLLARSLEISPGGSDDPRRASLAGWSRKLSPMKAFFTVPGGVGPLAFSPASLKILMVGPKKLAQLWDPEKENHVELAPPHGVGIISAAFSPDGRSVVTASADGTAQVWEVATGKAIARPLQDAGKAVLVAFSPNGEAVLTVSNETAQLWNSANGNRVGPPLTHPGPVKAVAFGSDGSNVLTASGQNAQVWNATTGERIGPLLRHEGQIIAVAFSPDGKTAVTGGSSDRSTAKLWSVPSGERIGDALPQAGAVKVLAFSPDGSTVVTGSDFGTAYLCEAATGRRIGSSLDHHRPLYTAAFSPDGRTVLTGSADGTGRLWDAVTGRPLSPSLPHHSPVTTVGFSPDGKTLLTASRDGAIRLWEAPLLETILPHTYHVHAGAFSPDGSTVLTGSGSLLPPKEGQAQLWNATTGTPTGPPLRHQDAVWAVAFNPDGKTVLTVAGNTCWLWNASTSERLEPSMKHESSGTNAKGERANPFIYAATFNHVGDKIATASGDFTAKLWDVATRKCRHTLEHAASVHAVAFSPDGSTLLTAAGDGAHLWVVDSGKRIGSPLPIQGLVYAVAFSFDGKAFVTAAGDTAQLWHWDGVAPSRLGRPMRHDGQIRAVTFSSKSRIVLTGSDDGTARLWDGNTGERIGRPLTHQREVWVVAFSSDGRLALTGSEDGTARLWETVSGKPIGPPFVHQWGLRAVAISPNNRTVLTGGGADKTARVWQLPLAVVEEVPRIVEWAQVITGRQIDANGGFSEIDAQSWQGHRVRLRKLGGALEP